MFFFENKNFINLFIFIFHFQYKYIFFYHVSETKVQPDNMNNTERYTN